MCLGALPGHGILGAGARCLVQCPADANACACLSDYDSAGTPHLKLIDFGLSALQDGPDSGDGAPKIGRMKTTVGTAYYISPEVVDKTKSYVSWLHARTHTPSSVAVVWRLASSNTELRIVALQ